MKDYEFDVEVEKVYTKSGTEVPGTRIVVRQDTGLPVATVSDKYMLVKHKTVMDAAEQFIGVFGEPERKFHMARNGARLVGEFTYRDRSNLIQVQKNDVVGLRVFVENSYNAEASVRVHVGAIVLACTNGMVVPRSVFSYSYKHVHSGKQIEFPNPSQVLDTYRNAAGVWQTYSERPLSEDGFDYQEAVLSAYGMDVITQSGRDRLTLKTGETYWDLMQNLTFEATHQGQITPIGRIQRLERISRFVNDVAQKRRLPVPEILADSVQ